MQMLKAQGLLVHSSEIDIQYSNHVHQLEQQGRPLASVLSVLMTTEASYRDRFEWQLNWSRYASTQITDSFLEETYNTAPRQYDGTRVRVSHILFRPQRSAGSENINSLVQRAQDLRRRIDAKEITFAEAAKVHSAGPSRTEGGDIGYITRRGEMDEAFSKAAFELPIGEISQPIVTPFGVHLITCTEVQPGNKTWSDARDLLRDAAAARLYELRVAEARKSAKIEFTGASPYLDPERRTVVEAGSPSDSAPTGQPQ
jgi:parvulin-like peptidyl-prolyl isomerase